MSWISCGLCTVRNRDNDALARDLYTVFTIISLDVSLRSDKLFVVCTGVYTLLSIKCASAEAISWYRTVFALLIIPIPIETYVISNKSKPIYAFCSPSSYARAS